MRALIQSLFANSEHYDLYLGAIETVEGIIRDFPGDAWKRFMLEEPEMNQRVLRTVYDSGLMGLGVDEKYNGMGRAPAANTCSPG